MSALESHDALEVRLHGNSDLFSRERLANVLDEFDHVLGHGSSEPDATISALKALHDDSATSAVVGASPTGREPMARSATKTLIGPRTDSERLVAEIWRELIGSDAFDVHAKFLDSGGQSLLIFQAAAKIARRTGIRLAPRVLAACTLAEIASRIEGLRPHQAPSRHHARAMAGGGDFRILVNAANSLVAAVKLRKCAVVGTGVHVTGRVWIHGKGRITIGDRVSLDGSTTPIELHADVGAEIMIGDDVSIEGGSSIEATHAVVIGARTHVGMYCKIMDSHYHSLSDRYQRPPSRALIVEEDVRLGPHVILTSGAHIGRGTVVGARTVVGRAINGGVVLRGAHAVNVRDGGSDEHR
jgi:acetyltransferase-like isoleucine patch superfamily enzyme